MPMISQDGKAQNEAARAIEGNTQKAERERSKAEQHEQDLDREEKELSKIQESLKGVLHQRSRDQIGQD